MPCLAMTTKHARLCELAVMGDEGYVALLCDESPPPEFPPLGEQVANFAGAVGRFIASGGKKRTPAEQERILNICGGCEFFIGSRCSRCGCQLPIKIAMASEHCPLDPPKW